MRDAIALLTLIALASCVAAPPPAPTPTRVPIASTPPPRPPAPPPAPADWRDWPQTAGDWRYAASDGGSVATFLGASGPVFAIRCVAVTHQVSLARFDPSAQPMTVRTSAGARTLPSLIAAGPPDASAATLPALDPLLDAIGFSRGRFIVEQPGRPALVLPAWAEVERVVEDCRG